ncbi:hypothetical protein TIFTF001_027939 [Ficus carica]|uniref:Uncharacterized protein n=1 Tax=Ficus carica TaxID=3494 RepID=A0AA88DNY8_FICCA|nr:hypothetical protein TIFTF001_027939 [Ficus carica]
MISLKTPIRLHQLKRKLDSESTNIDLQSINITSRSIKVHESARRGLGLARDQINPRACQVEPKTSDSRN